MGLPESEDDDPEEYDEKEERQETVSIHKMRKAMELMLKKALLQHSFVNFDLVRTFESAVAEEIVQKLTQSRLDCYFSRVDQ